MIVGRKALLAKSGSRCWYCGARLTKRTMQRDHVLPLVRWRTARWTFSGRHGCSHPERHRADNIVACCKPCNQRKGALDLEQFRLTCPGKKKHKFYFETLEVPERCTTT